MHGVDALSQRIDWYPTRQQALDLLDIVRGRRFMERRQGDISATAEKIVGEVLEQLEGALLQVRGIGLHKTNERDGGHFEKIRAMGDKTRERKKITRWRSISVIRCCI
ncbi:hypothetical protein PsorP6_011725 [Peronosclerospora sorghi]|uniref:Uncharacterized protein n=1 Tax=Peronosclerospora sorghi TaxID=230839 RepID=A0ACC0WJT2_9STRA|nr:hypothetical protein PsorP6_011725 [Peronosclerospora sorghi]